MSMRRIVLVKSCQANKAKQEACSKTWVTDVREAGVPVWFVEGGHVPQSVRDYRLHLSVGDLYMANSIKVREAVKLLLRLEKFDYLFICDDDTFVHPQRWLDHSPEGEFECLMTKKIPWCHGGGGWWMSKRCCGIYVRNVSRRCSWDDKLASEIMQKKDIQISNRPDLYSQWKKQRVSISNTLITCHEVSPQEMYSLYRKTCL